ncbi:MAG: ATP-binding protein [Bacilli bacterium]
MKKTDIEKSIIKKYRKEIWSKFIKAIKDYKLIKENDKIAVCMSGGKDSALLALCLEELKRHGLFNFELKYIVMDPGYKKEHLKLIKDNFKTLNLDINMFKTDIFKVANKLNKESPCYLCARMRRGHLYNKAKELGCNKIALGHHFNDVIETIMLNILYNGSYKTMMPKIKSTNFKGLELIRPMYYIKEENIIKWQNYNNLEFLDCACTITAKKKDSKRLEVKELIKRLKKTNKDVDMAIFKSSSNIYMDTVIGWKKGDKDYNFLDEYEGA